MPRPAALLAPLAALLLLGWREAARGDGLPPSPATSLLEEARAAAAAKDPAKALPLYVAALRRADEYGTKYAIRDEVLALPPVPARPLSPAEQATVTARISEERERDVAKKADAFESEGKPHAARLLHERLRGLLGLAERQVD